MYIQYSLAYIAFFLVIVFLFLVESISKNNDLLCGKSLSIFSYATLFLVLNYFICCRGYVGSDVKAYYTFYQDTPTIFSSLSKFNNFFKSWNYEKGFSIYSIICKTLFRDSFLAFQFFNSAIDLIILHSCFKKYCKENYIFCWFFFSIFYGLYYEMYVLRNVKSIMIFFLSIQYIYDRRPLKFYLLNTLGLLFHSSTIFFMPMYFLAYLKRNKKIEISIFIIGNLLFLSGFSLTRELLLLMYGHLPSPYNGLVYGYVYGESFNNARGLSIGFLERDISFIIFYLMIDDIAEKNKVDYLFWFLYLMYNFINLFFSDFVIIADRVVSLFILSYWILYPKVYVRLNRERKLIFLFLFVVYGLLKFKSLYSADKFFYYENIFTGALSPEDRFRLFIK